MDIRDYFDRIFVLHLASRSDRLKLISRELKRSGLDFQKGKVELFTTIKPATADGFCSPGVRGCFLGHLAIMKEAKRLGLRNVLIMEDDLMIADLFKTKQNEIVQTLKSTPWGFVYFGHVLEQLPLLDRDDLVFQPYHKDIATTHFYALNGSILDRCILFLEAILKRPSGHPDGGPMHLDGACSWFRKINSDVVTLVAVPSLGWQQSSRSELHGPKWFDRVAGIRHLGVLVRAYRNWRDRLEK